MTRRSSRRVTRAPLVRAGAGLAGAVLLSLLTASAARSSDEPDAHLIASGHGVAHDARAVAAIDRWLALGQPTGWSMVASAARRDDGPVDRTVTIRTSGSNLAFDPDQLSLKAGTRVRIQYINDGVLPHNFVVLKSEDDLDALGAAAYDAEATGFVPLDQKDKLIAYTTLAAPGTTVSVTFEVPSPGSYTFVCLFPGHYNVMLGTLRALR